MKTDISPELRQQRSDRMKRRWADPVERRKLSGTVVTQEKKRQIMKAHCNEPGYLKRILSRRPPSNEETAFMAFLADHGFSYQYVGDGSLVIGGRNPDFLSADGQKRLIELWGDCYHQQHMSQSRIEHFSQYGYRTLIIWASEMVNPDIVAEKIKKFEGG